jgi:hypothetical protein
MPPKNQTHRIDDLLGSVTEELMLGNPQQFEDNSIRAERLLLEMVRPDPVQPRRVLPEQLHFAFHSNRLTPTQALKELVQLVQVAARQRGRPFNNVLELLPNPDDETEEDSSVHLSPEEQLLHDLIHTDELFAPRAEGLGGFDQEVQERGMTHEAVNFIDGDDARLFVDEAVAANGTQDLCVRQCLQDGVTFQFVKAEDTRLNLLPAAA